ncbi:MAG: hypothetical protein ACTHLZ_17155, partial [Tepidisphaeraceae bacterium]
NDPVGNPSATTSLTSSENLVMALCGGLTATTTANTYQFDLNAINQGPASLNSAKPGKTPAFMEAQPGELTTTVPNERYIGTGLPAGEWMGPYASPETARPTDSPLPEILDSFGSPRPILYLRANKGASGFISYTGSATPNSPQYDILQLAAYGFPQSDTGKPDPNGTKTISDYYPATGYLPAGLPAYFGNSELSTSTTLVPQHKDQYILISAGPDGLYGTADDIRN